MEEKTVGLRELREEAGKTRKEVAKFLGVSIQAVARYENGERRIGIEQILPLAAFYGVTAEELIITVLSSYQSDR